MSSLHWQRIVHPAFASWNDSQNWQKNTPGSVWTTLLLRTGALLAEIRFAPQTICMVHSCRRALHSRVDLRQEVLPDRRRALKGRALSSGTPA